MERFVSGHGRGDVVVARLVLIQSLEQIAGKIILTGDCPTGPLHLGVRSNRKVELNN
jgi:hypothetical protein